MGTTLYFIGEASENEDGGVRNTFLGDQTGFELRARRWYEHNPIWGKVYRFNDPNVAEDIASRMEKAILNGYIGYDSNHRESYRREIEKTNFDVSAVHTNCGTDCSALGYTAVRGATGVVYDNNDQYPTIFHRADRNSIFGRQYDYYIERQCVNAGYDITVFTLDTTLTTPTADSVTITFSNGTQKHYLEPYYNTPYDVYDPGADSLNVRDNLHVVYLNKPNDFGYDEAFLNTLLLTNKEGDPMESAWKRGDIIRTIMVPRNDGSGKYNGHIAVWL